MPGLQEEYSQWDIEVTCADDVQAKIAGGPLACLVIHVSALLIVLLRTDGMANVPAQVMQEQFMFIHVDDLAWHAAGMT